MTFPGSRIPARSTRSAWRDEAPSRRLGSWGRAWSLRPLRNADFDQWREVRAASREWLEPWEPQSAPGAADPVTDADAFRARCAAWDRQRQFDAAYGFGLFLGDDERFDR